MKTENWTENKETKLNPEEKITEMEIKLKLTVLDINVLSNGPVCFEY